MSAPTEWQDAIIANLGTTIRELRGHLEGALTLLHDRVKVPPLVRHHISNLLDYNEEKERADYEREVMAGEENGDPVNHIYTAICSIREWLDSLPEQEPIT